MQGMNSTQSASEPVLFLVREGWENKANGVATFLRHLTREMPNCLPYMKAVSIPLPGLLAPSRAPGVVQGGRHMGAEDTLSARLALGYLRQCFEDMRVLWRMRRLLRGRRIVVNEYGCETLPIAVRLLKPFTPITAIAHTHPGAGAYGNHIVRRAVERLCNWCMSDVIYNSASNQKEWGRKLGLPVVRGNVIYYGIDRVDPAIPTNYPPKPGGVVDFVYVSRFAGWKGQMQMVRAWALARQHGLSEARLVFVGDGPMEVEVRKHCDELGVGGSVIFMGCQPDGGRYFNGGDVAVQLSTEPEAFGLAILEAMTCGKAVLASRIGGLVEFVEDSKTGLLVDPHDEDAVAQAILRLSHSDAERMQWGIAGRAKWEKQYTVERMIQDYSRQLAAC